MSDFKDVKTEPAQHLEHASSIPSSEGELNLPAEDWSDINEAKLMRRIDLHLIPWLSVCYLLSFLDRTAIGNAKTFGLEQDLGLTDTQYNIALTIFFFPYALFEPITNVLLKRLSPRWFLSGILFLWAIAMVGQGLVKNYHQLLAVRFLLGAFEAGLFPGVNFLLSSWYRREEFGKRGAIFFSAATASGAFGGLLAAAISKMDGIGGYSGARWIFIIEGLITFLCALVSPWLIYGFPDTATFLTPRERAFVVNRLRQGSMESAGGETFKWSSIRTSSMDWKLYLGMLIYAGSDMPLYAFSLFTPSIIKNLGYSSIKANLLSVPIYLFACIITIGLGFVADRTRRRGIYNLGFMAIGLVGYIILIASRLPGLSYFAIFLAAAGIYPLIPNTIAWTSNNTEGVYRRGFQMGCIIAFGNICGAVSSNVYRGQDAPWYMQGHAVVLAFIGIGFICSLLYLILLKRENAKRDRGERDEIIVGKEGEANGITSFHSVQEAKQKLGDKHSQFRYIL